MADFINNKDNNIFVDGEEKFLIEDVSKGNAGYSFELNEDWVKRWKNIDNASYKAVRDEDQIDSVVTSTKNMQFTHTQNQSDVNENLKKYIRLLMPKYTRRVEVEDLNRNFWVIGQALSAIGAYLFEQQKVTDIHSEVVYLNNFTNYPDYYSTKFDNFEESSTNWNINSQNSILDRLEHFKKLYPQTILIIIPVIRRDNYKHNYYSTELYPGIAIYNPNHLSNDNNGWKIIKFTDGDNKTGLITLSSDSDITDQLLGTNTDDENNIYYGSYKQIREGTLKEGSNESSKYYKACLRTIPHITYHLDSSNKVIIDDFSITLQDAAWRAAVTTGKSDIGTLSAIDDFNENTEFQALTRSLTTRTFSRTNIGVVGQKVGFYLGEVLSTKSVQSVVEEITTNYDIRVSNVNLEPIVPLFETLSSTTDIENDAKNVLENITSDTNNMKAVFGSDIDLEQVRLILGKKEANLYQRDGDCTLNSYWKLNSGGLSQTIMESDSSYTKDGEHYNGAKETVFLGSALYFPQKSTQQNFNYEFVANPLPVINIGSFPEETGLHGKIEPDPDEWRGGRTMCSYISPSAIKGKRLASERHSSLYNYYAVLTEDGNPIKDSTSKWAVVYTQIYVCFGVLPYYYSQVDSSKGLYYFNDGVVYATTSSESPFVAPLSNNVLIDAAGRDGILEIGAVNSNETIPKWSSDYTRNKSCFVSEEGYGWPLSADIMGEIIMYMKNNNVTRDTEFIVNFVPTSSEEIPWWTIEPIQGPTVTVHAPYRAGPTSCLLGEINKPKQMEFFIPGEFSKITVVKSEDNYVITDLGNFDIDKISLSKLYKFKGSVIKVATHIFKSTGDTISKEWSAYGYDQGQFKIKENLQNPLTNSIKELCRNKEYDIAYMGGKIPGESNLFNIWKNTTTANKGYNKYLELLGRNIIPDYEQYPLNGNDM